MIEDLGDGVWRWDLPHPEWRPRSERVNCYVVRHGGGTVVIDPLCGDVSAELFALPQHKERPVQVADTLAFGDRFVGIDGGLRIWAQRPFSDRYRERLRTYVAPLLERDFERVLVGHGAPVLRGGKAALAEALDAPTWTGD